MRTSIHRTTGTAMAAVLLFAGTAHAQYGPGMGADQLVLRDPATGNVFVLRAPTAAGTPSSYTLELPSMGAGVPAVPGILLTIDNSAGPVKKTTLIPPVNNSVLITNSGAPFYSTTLPAGLTIPNANLSNPTITGGTAAGTAITGGSINNTPIGNTTPNTGTFTNLNSTGNTAIGTGAGSTTAVGNATGATTIDGSSITVGHAGGTTTMNGTVNFTNAPGIPLPQNNIWVGNASGQQQATAPSPNSVLVTNNVAGGTPSWSTTFPTGLTLPGATITNPTVTGATITGGTINNTPIGATTPNTGAFTTLTSTGTSSIGTNSGSIANIGNTAGGTNVQGLVTNIGTTDNAPAAGGLESTINLGYDDQDAGGPSGPSIINMRGTINFSTAPTIPLPQNNIWVGNASNNQQATAPTPNSVLTTDNTAGGTPAWRTTFPSGLTLPGATVTNPILTGGTINNTPIGATTPSTGSFTNLNSTGNTGVGTGAGSTTTVGNATGTTTIDGSSITVGHAGGTTTMNGTVTFANAPTIPLAQNNIWVGNASGNQQAKAPSPNSVLVTDNVAGGTPTWSTTFPSGLTLPGATVTNPTITGGSINNTPIGNTTPSTGVFTNLTANTSFASNGTTTLGDGAGADNFTVNPGTGTVSFSNARIQNVGAPTTGGDAANKTYVDNAVSALVLAGDVTGPNGTNTINPANAGIGDRLIAGVNNGTTTINDARVTDALTINGGTVNNSPIGATTPSTGAFTTLTSSGNSSIATGSGNTANIGNVAGGTTIQGLVTQIGTVDNNPTGGGLESSITLGYNDQDAGGPSGPSMININGLANFANLPSLPLAQNAILVGNASGVAAPTASTNRNGAMLVQNSSGTPTWSTAGTVTSTTGTAPQILLNNADLNNGSGTESDITIGYTDPDGSTAANGPSTTNIRGTVNINTADPGRTTPQNVTIGYNDPDGAGTNVASLTTINGDVSIGNRSGFRNSLGIYSGTIAISGNTAFSGGRWITTIPTTAATAGAQITVTWDDGTTAFPSYKVSGRTATNFTVDWSANPVSGNLHYIIIQP